MKTIAIAQGPGWACFILVRRLESVARCPDRPSRRGDFLSMIEGTMSTMTIVFVLIILLFGFDSTGQGEGRSVTHLRLPIAREISEFLKSRSSKA